MNPNDPELVKGAYLRWLNGEPLSIADYKRVIERFVSHPPELSAPAQNEAMTLLAQARDMLAQLVSPQKTTQP